MWSLISEYNFDLQLIFNGITIGSILALAAIGLTLTYGILNLSNFAHGDFMTLGAYLAWLAMANPIVENIGFGVNSWLSQNLGLLNVAMIAPVISIIVPLFLGIVGTILAMLLVEYVLWKPMRERRASDTTLIIISIGLALFVRNGILLIFGGSNKPYPLPLVRAMKFGDLRITYYSIVVVVLAILAITALHLILRYTKIGKAMRAVADNIDLARVSGINVEKVVIWTWVITGTLTATAGVMYGLITAPRPQMGWFLILPMFAAVILGGIGNPYGAIAGAMVIGIAQELSVPLLGSEYKLAVALTIMIFILLVRPQGLFKG